MTLKRLRQLSDDASGRLRSAEAAARAEKKALAKYNREAATALEAQRVLQLVAEKVQSEAHRQIADVVTRALQTVFGPSYAFKINFRRLRGRTDAELWLLKDGHEVDATEGDSGGVTEVAAFALRLACLLLARPQRRRFLALDEPFRNVHGTEYRRRTAALVRSLAKELKVQFVIVTGLDWLKDAGKVIDFGGE